jgi:Zn-dependent protease
VLLGEPPPTPYDLHFAIFGIPVRVHPFFWVIAILFGFNAGEILAVLIWVVAMFLAIMVHELGHALVMRRYGFSPRIILYGMGGLASAGPASAYSSAGNSARAQVLISAAGPGAGFLLAGLIVALLMLVGPGVEVVHIDKNELVPCVAPAGMIGSYALTLFIWDLLFICIFWGFINLLPVYPLDGGQIAQRMLVAANPVDGVRQSLQLSMVTAIVVAVIGSVLMQELFIAIMFGFLAFFSYRALQFHQGRGPW